MSARTVVVVGGARGIGAGVVRRFAAAGDAVAILDVREEQAQELATELAEMDVSACAVACDVSRPESIEAAHEAVRDRLGPTDVLVNSAAVIERKTLEEHSYADWTRLIDVNLNGMFWTSRTFGADMLERGRGAIVNIASIAALSPQPVMGAYSATKAAVVLMTQNFALEWGPRGVRSNVVSPGFIRTLLTEPLYADPYFHRARADIVPQRRIGDTEDIAGAVEFLASDAAGYVNGANLVVDGGVSLTVIEQYPTIVDGRLVPNSRLDQLSAD